MYYKVIYNDKVIDVLDRLVYLRHQAKHDRMVLCKEDEAQAIFSSDREHVWHVEGFYDMPTDEHDTVRLIEVDRYEYEQLKALNGKTRDEIIDETVALMLDDKMGLLIDSLKRLYEGGRIDESKVVELCKSGKITDEQKGCVLGN